MIFINFLIGSAIGLLLGFTGAGGSILTLPALIYLIHLDTKEAIFTSLIIVGISSFAGFLQQVRQKNICIRLGLWVGSGGILGAYLGSKISFYLSGQQQLLIFALTMLSVSISMFLKSKFKISFAVPKEGCKLSAPLSIFLGIGSGFLTGLVGVGGGFIIGPVLIMNGLNTHLAIGTSLLIITLNCISGLIGYWGEYTLNIPLLISFTSGAVFFSILGARWAKKISTQKLEFIFSIFIFVMGAWMLVKNVGVLFKN